MPKILIVGHGFVGQAVDYGFSHPKIEKTNTKTGTIIIPPPTPNIPARIPANEPTRRYARSSTNIQKLIKINW